MSANDGPESIALVSGGLDSCVALAWALDRGYRVRFLHVTYGQRTERREIEAVQAIGDHYDIPSDCRRVVSIGYLKELCRSSLLDGSAEILEQGIPSREGIPSTYVPFRNTHLLAIAASWAEGCGASKIVIGAVQEDSSGYPDCRREYYDAFNALLRVAAAYGPLSVETPLIHLTKREIVLLGHKLGAPLHLTWSCYKSVDRACGRCESCALRLRGFQAAGLDDPIPYAERPQYFQAGNRSAR